MLQFDTRGLINEFLSKLQIELDIAGQYWENEAKSKLRGISVSEGDSLKAEIDSEIKKKTNGLVLYLRANAVALADSYGVGSLMSSDNPRTARIYE